MYGLFRITRIPHVKIKMMQNLPQRKSIRLKKYDYSQNGAYFVTICTQNRECLLGNIIDRKMVLNDAGRMINDWWLQIPQRFENVTLDEYQIMPNHLHGIITIDNGRTRGSAPTITFTPTTSLSTVGVDLCVNPNDTTNRSQQLLFRIIRWFKTMSTNEYIRNVKNNNWNPFDKRLWQRNYYEHIVRDEDDLNKIREYIKNNPQMWDRDRNNLYAI